MGGQFYKYISKFVFFQKVEKSHITIVKFEVENLKLKICVQIPELIKNNNQKRQIYHCVLLHWHPFFNFNFSEEIKFTLLDMLQSKLNLVCSFSLVWKLHGNLVASNFEKKFFKFLASLGYANLKKEIIPTITIM